MRVLTLETGPEAGEDFLGTVLCQTVARSATSKATPLRKGQLIQEDDLSVLRSIERQGVRVIRLEDGDLHEDVAGRRLAVAIAGPGVDLRGPVQSRVNLVAAVRGIAVIDPSALRALNLVPDVAVFTVPPFRPVQPGDLVAGAKIVPVVAREDAISRVERIAREAWPIVQVRRF